MDFTTSFFVTLILIFYSLLYGLKKSTNFSKEATELFVLMFSLLLYGLWYPPGIIILLYTIIVSYFIAILLSKKPLKIYLFIGVFLSLAPLLFFKYTNFIISIWIHSEFPKTNWILPIGISFYVFTSIAYQIDTFREKRPIALNFKRVALLVSFWPHLAAGPILRKNLLTNPKHFFKKINSNHFLIGIILIVIGASKKIFIADNLASYINYNLSLGIENMNFVVAWLTILGFSGQIYADFSAYSEMAIGFALLIGYKLPANFNFPYRATNITEFWRRWHISLSTWFRDYVYIPLGGRSNSKLKSALTILTVFTISGLWHGAAYNFIVWGLLHGIFLLIHRVFLSSKIAIPKLLSWVITFMAINWAWVFFRLNIYDSIKMTQALINLNSRPLIIYNNQYLTLPIIFILGFVVYDHIFKCYTVTDKSKLVFFKERSRRATLIYTTLLLFLASFFAGESVPFIYFEF